MADGGNSPGLWASLVAAIPGLGALGWAIFRQTEGGTKHTVVVAQDAEEHSAESARAVLDDAQKEWFDGMRAERREVREEIALLRKDRDRGWDLARAWREISWRERHARNNLLQITGGSALDPLPGLEEIEGKKS